MDLTNEDVADILALLDSLPYDSLDVETPRFRLTLRRAPGGGWTEESQLLAEPTVVTPATDDTAGAPAGASEMPGAAPVFACAGPGGCHESVVGAGLKFNWSANRWLTAWYSAGVSGANTVRTNALYLRFVNVF